MDPPLTRDDFEDLERHVHALYTHDPRGRIVTINEPNGRKPAPHLYLGRSKAGNLWRLRADLPEALVEALSGLCATEPVLGIDRRVPLHAEEYLTRLGAHVPVRQSWNGPAYRFTLDPGPVSDVVDVTPENASHVLRGGFEAWLPDVADWQPFVAALDAGRAVSVCQSVRITPQAHEAGVETLAEYRGKGFARRAVVAWARRVLDRGAAALYSTSWENVASRSLARSLGLDMYAVDFHVS